MGYYLTLTIIYTIAIAVGIALSRKFTIIRDEGELSAIGWKFVFFTVYVNNVVYILLASAVFAVLIGPSGIVDSRLEQWVMAHLVIAWIPCSVVSIITMIVVHQKGKKTLFHGY